MPCRCGFGSQAWLKPCFVFSRKWGMERGMEGKEVRREREESAPVPERRFQGTRAFCYDTGWALNSKGHILQFVRGSSCTPSADRVETNRPPRLTNVTSVVDTSGLSGYASWSVLLMSLFSQWNVRAGNALFAQLCCDGALTNGQEGWVSGSGSTWMGQLPVSKACRLLDAKPNQRGPREIK